MITPAHAQLMARYNKWQNQSVFNTAETLSDIERRQDRTAFWGSIHSTLVHILWGDEQWMNRFADWPKPDKLNTPASLPNISDWSQLRLARQSADKKIEDWASSLTTDWLAADVMWYSGAAGRELSKPAWILVTHFFNHQTHHRGQVHAMLTGAGAKTDDTDLFLMPDL
jgi:uncharacterized damage-inducible protein DinB